MMLGVVEQAAEQVKSIFTAIEAGHFEEATD